MKNLIRLAVFEFLVLAAVVAVRTALWTYGADTGTFAQLVGDAGFGMRDALEHGSHFRFHWSPSLELLWPAVAWTHSPVMLQLVQAAAIAATAPLLAILLRPYLGDRMSYRIGIVALLYPPLIALGFGEFHELGLFPPLAIAIVLAADRARWGWYAACVLVALGLREDVCIELAIVGLVFFAAAATAPNSERGLLAWSPLHRRSLALAGLGTTFAACTTLAVYYLIITPRLGGWMPSHFYAYDFARGPAGVLVAGVVQPLAFAREIFTTGRATYVLEALAPLALLPLLSRWSLLAVPGATMVLLANSGYVWRMGDHYAALWIPWLLIGAGLGLARVRAVHENRARLWTASAAALCCVFLVAFNPMHPLHYLHPAYQRLSDARSAFGCVPPDASSSTHDEWYAATAAQFPNETAGVVDGPQYLIYAADYPNEAFQRDLRPAIEREVRLGTYRVVCRYGNVAVYKRAPN